MAIPKPYRLTDQTIARLNRKIIRQTQQTKRRLLNAKFDELNVIREIESLFAVLDAENRKRYRELYAARYTEMFLYLTGRESVDEDGVDELAELFITGLLSKPNAVTNYAYDAEVPRKRERAAEAILSVPTSVQKQLEMDKAMRFWSQMTQQYADAASDGAGIQAMKDAGIEYGRWYTQEDEKVCRKCDKLDGEVFRLDQIPEKPHWRCRCWIEPLDAHEMSIR